MTGDAIANLKTGGGQTITGDLAAASLKTGGGQTITGDAADVVGGGITIMGELAASLNTGGGHTMTGELAASPRGADEKCGVGAATALTADRAIAEPITTHETFNHDEGIWNTPQRATKETGEKTNANSAIPYNKSTGKSEKN